MYEIPEDDLHELGRLFMDQFAQCKPMSLDDFLYIYSEILTDDERNLGHHILGLFDKEVKQ